MRDYLARRLAQPNKSARALDLCVAGIVLARTIHVLVDAAHESTWRCAHRAADADASRVLLLHLASGHYQPMVADRASEHWQQFGNLAAHELAPVRHAHGGGGDEQPSHSSVDRLAAAETAAADVHDPVVSVRAVGDSKRAPRDACKRQRARAEHAASGETTSKRVACSRAGAGSSSVDRSTGAQSAPCAAPDSLADDAVDALAMLRTGADVQAPLAECASSGASSDSMPPTLCRRGRRQHRVRETKRKARRTANGAPVKTVPARAERHDKTVRDRVVAAHRSDEAHDCTAAALSNAQAAPMSEPFEQRVDVSPRASRLAQSAEPADAAARLPEERSQELHAAQDAYVREHMQEVATRHMRIANIVLLLRTPQPGTVLGTVEQVTAHDIVQTCNDALPYGGLRHLADDCTQRVEGNGGGAPVFPRHRALRARYAFCQRVQCADAHPR